MCKQSKYMYARRLNYLCFMFGCMHARILHVLYVRPTRETTVEHLTAKERGVRSEYLLVRKKL